MNEKDDALSWPLEAYGLIIRGDETTSEDQVASASTPEIAQRLVACWNACAGMTMEELTVMALEARAFRRAL